MKTDARVKYTVKVIKEAFLKILENKPITKISVKEVAEAAEVNRATFYSHFSDCYDLLERIENDLLNDFRSMVDVYCLGLAYVSSALQLALGRAHEVGTPEIERQQTLVDKVGIAVDVKEVVGHAFIERSRHKEQLVLNPQFGQCRQSHVWLKLFEMGRVLVGAETQQRIHIESHHIRLGLCGMSAR